MKPISASFNRDGGHHPVAIVGFSANGVAIVVFEDGRVSTAMTSALSVVDEEVLGVARGNRGGGKDRSIPASSSDRSQPDDHS